MKLFIQLNDYHVWKLIFNDPNISTKKVNGIYVPKEQDEWDENDVKKVQLNSKAMHILFCALGPNEYNKVSMSSNAKEAWDKLETTHEGTYQVRKTKISMLTLEYELFFIGVNETINEMTDRFTDIINGLKVLGKNYTNK